MSADDMIRRGDALKLMDQYAFEEAFHRVAILPAVTPKVRPLVWQLMAGREGLHYHAFDPLYGRDVEAPNEATCDAIDQTRATRILAALDLTPAPDAVSVDAATAERQARSYADKPAPDAAALREAALREAMERVAECLAGFEYGEVSKYAREKIRLALLPKGGA